MRVFGDGCTPGSIDALHRGVRMKQANAWWTFLRTVIFFRITSGGVRVRLMTAGGQPERRFNLRENKLAQHRVPMFFSQPLQQNRALFFPARCLRPDKTRSSSYRFLFFPIVRLFSSAIIYTEVSLDRRIYRSIPLWDVKARSYKLKWHRIKYSFSCFPEEYTYFFRKRKEMRLIYKILFDVTNFVAK